MDYSIRKLVSTKLTRKEFLLYIGVLFAGLLGIPSFLKLLVDTHPNMQSKKISGVTSSQKTIGYGTGAYGV